MEPQGEMGKPPSLSRRRGLRGGCDFSLAQTKAWPWHLSADSCVSQLLNSQTQGRCQFQEGGDTDTGTHTPLPPLPHSPARAVPPVAHPTLGNSPGTSKTQGLLGLRKSPILHGPTALPPCMCPAKPAASALGRLCPAKEELRGGGVWQKTGPLCLVGCLSLKLLFLGPEGFPETSKEAGGSRSSERGGWRPDTGAH